MIKKILLTLILLTFGIPAFAGNPNDTQCADESGAAYGFCVAASHLDCGTDAEKNEGACIKIENNYIQVTGEEPPWLAVCPCWIPEEVAGLRHPNYVNRKEVSFCTNGGISGVVFNWTIYRLKIQAGDTLNYRAMIHAEQETTRVGFPKVFNCKLEDACGANAEGGCTNTVRVLSISEEEYVRCAADVIESGLERGFDCFTE